jgi:hypothetical protein
MIKIDTHKIEHQPKNRHLFETVIPRKQTKINNTVNFSINSILNDEIKKKLKTIKRQKKKSISYQWVNSSKKINNVVNFPINPILNNEIKKRID